MTAPLDRSRYLCEDDYVRAVHHQKELAVQQGYADLGDRHLEFADELLAKVWNPFINSEGGADSVWIAKATAHAQIASAAFAAAQWRAVRNG